MQRFFRLVVTIVLLALPAQPVLAARMALVIGNANYQNTAPLATPKNDAFAFSDFLRTNDFTVTEVVDGDRAAMAAALASFVKALQPNDTAVFYYAGHGLQVDGENYLMGIEAQLLNEFDVAAESMPLSQIVSQMEKRANVSMVFIDACRDNPLADRLASTTRGVSVGLAPLEATGEGTMIAFAAAPGGVALDGDINSPFTRALIDNLAEPEVEVGTALKRVIRDVRDATASKQIPQIVSSMSVEFFFSLDVKMGIIIDPEPGEPTLDVKVPEPEPTAPPGPEIASLPPTPTPAPAVLPMSRDTELDLAAARRIGTLRALQLFMEKHRSEVGQARSVDTLAIVVASNAYTANIAGASIEDQLGLDEDGRTAAQRLLAAAGYDTGTPDGAFGPVTRDQIRAFQLASGEPDTGYLSTQTLASLGMLSAMGAPSPVMSHRASVYDAKDLARLETDERLLRAIKCLGARPVNYGFFGDHVYLAVQGDGDYDTTRKTAATCGGHLVTITSKEENAFVFSLISADPTFFDVGSSPDGAWVSGPAIGLAQSSKKKEPAGDWEWVTGETLAYNAWGSYQPDNHKGVEDKAHFWVEVPRGAKDPLKYIKPTWNDSPDGGHGYIMEID